MGRELQESNWLYEKLRTGYRRYKPYVSMTPYMYKILSQTCNRGWWRRVLELSICKRVLGHVNDKHMTIERGYTNENGTYEITLCKRCRCRVVFYEKGDKWIGTM